MLHAGNGLDHADRKRLAESHFWCDLFLALAEAVQAISDFTDAATETLKERVKRSIRGSDRDGVRTFLADKLVDKIVDTAVSPFLGWLGGINVLFDQEAREEAVRLLRILAVLCCPSPSHHEKLRKHAMAPLAQDAADWCPRRRGSTWTTCSANGWRPVRSPLHAPTKPRRRPRASDPGAGPLRAPASDRGACEHRRCERRPAGRHRQRPRRLQPTLHRRLGSSPPGTSRAWSPPTPPHRRRPAGGAEARGHRDPRRAGLHERDGRGRGARDVLAEMSDHGFVVHVCTSPLSTRSRNAAEKLDWIEDHLGAGVMSPTWRHVVFERPFNRDAPAPSRMTWATWREALLRQDHGA